MALAPQAPSPATSPSSSPHSQVRALDQGRAGHDWCRQPSFRLLGASLGLHPPHSYWLPLGDVVVLLDKALGVHHGGQYPRKCLYLNLLLVVGYLSPNCWFSFVKRSLHNGVPPKVEGQPKGARHCSRANNHLQASLQSAQATIMQLEGKLSTSTSKLKEFKGKVSELQWEVEGLHLRTANLAKEVKYSKGELKHAVIRSKAKASKLASRSFISSCFNSILTSI